MVGGQDDRDQGRPHGDDRPYVAEAGRERDDVCKQRGREAGEPWQNRSNDTAGKSIRRLEWCPEATRGRSDGTV
jgi:hypothetical protein